MEKDAALKEAHLSLAEIFKLNVGDVELGFPIAKFDDAVRIAEDMKATQKRASEQMVHAKSAAAAFIICALPLFPLSGRELAIGVAIEGATLLASATFYVASKSSLLLRKDRESEVKAAIAHAKTPAWIHRLEHEGRL